MNSENPFLTKIMFEEQYCQDDLFSVVQDIDPIVFGHYMIYSREWQPSLADCDYSNMVRFIEGPFTRKAKIPYTYFERGRASFCTSMQGVKHGHGHLVPRFTDRLANVFPYGKVEKYENMEDAYRHVTTDGQYLIWGNIGEEFYIINGVEEIPKRAIRNTIRTYEG